MNQVKSKQLGDLMQEIILHEIDVITDSDWFLELVEERIKKIIKEQEQ